MIRMASLLAHYLYRIGLACVLMSGIIMGNRGAADDGPPGETEPPVRLKKKAKLQSDAPTEQPSEQTEFTVQLDGFDAAKKINVIKIVREISGLGLKEAKDLVEGAPKPVKENVSKEEAQAIKK